MGSIPTESLFSELADIPLDPHYALKEDFSADPAPKKVILGSGIYRDGNGMPWVLPTVKEAEEIVDSQGDPGRYDYLQIAGYAPFYTAARDLLFGSLDTKVESIVSVQTVSGTGANSLGARFLSESLKPSAVWLSNPSWVNHANIWSLVGVEVKYYPYWNAEKRCLDFENMIGTLESHTKPGDVIVLHGCAHNPTGVDPTKDQWKTIADICQRHGLFPFFDNAYQGFASGDLDEDAWALRHFAGRETMELAAAQSFSKNMGLYGERVGALHILTASPDAASKVKGNVLRIQRGQVSQPPRRGAALATTILANGKLFQKWLLDLREMSSRIKDMRKALHEELGALGTPGNWEHILTQIGMFSYTGLSPAQVENLRAESHVYILTSGRISVPGLNHGNVKYVAAAIDKAAREELA
ncbi:Aspartate aminotransferase [Penicillium malachiteum]|uniref:Aspartate aminotransferase n=1 Tax=Penicillium malachiteum TaxID=1324776 RepID=UPI002547582E|nr:Aspartate aminotransferase [Penicillium malachiteum]KAJ5729470.1 Aspartate aminotransferase [Penicillium malachiteum]